jgi:hypothetical protein
MTDCSLSKVESARFAALPILVGEEIFMSITVTTVEYFEGFCATTAT